jgi:hypothetical protein
MAYKDYMGSLYYKAPPLTVGGDDLTGMVFETAGFVGYLYLNIRLPHKIYLIKSIIKKKCYLVV